MCEKYKLFEFLTEDELGACRSSLGCSEQSQFKILFSFCVGFKVRDESYLMRCIVVWQEVLATGT